MSVRRSRSILAPLAVVAALLLALVAAAGCGDEDAEAITIETSSLGKEQYVKQADMRCAQERAKALNELGASSPRFGTADPEPAFERGSRRILAPSLERQADAIRALGAPEGGEEQIEALLIEMERASAALVENPASDFRDYGARLRRAADLAGEYGFTQCASALLI